MNRSIKTVITLIIISALLTIGTLNCFAVENQNGNVASTRQITYPLTGITLYGTASDKLYINTSWKTIAEASNGFNCKIVILVPDNLNGNANDVRMLDKNGNQIWFEEYAIASCGDRCFECGANVYKIQIRTRGSYAHAYAGYVGN